jgi:multidrug resistance efflux pump
MKKINSLLVTVAVVFMSSSAMAGELDKDALQAKLEKAEAKYAMAVEKNFAWTTTAPLLASAKEALEKDDLATAKKLLKQAMAEVKGSLAQAKESEENWQSYVVK